MRALKSFILSALLAVSAGASATLTQPMVAGQTYIAPTGDTSQTTVTATGGTTAITNADINAFRLNLKFFGAKGDTLAYPTGAATAGSSTITSSTGFFTAAMVGKVLVVSGSGTGGIPQVGTVTAFNSITSITASFTAVTSINPTTIVVGTDDTAAMLAFQNAIQAAFAKPVTGYIPTGTYFVKLGSFPTLNRGRIVGDGAANSLIYLDPSTTGDLFAFSETWGGFAAGGQISGEGGDIPATSNGRSGSGVIGVGIRGSKTAFSGDQNAIVFYDRNDSIKLKDVSVKNIVGSCFSVGKTKNIPTQAYARESHDLSLTCFNTGSATQPAVELSSTTASGSDATNQLYWTSLDIFNSASAGLIIDNVNNFNATRQIEFDVLRVEKSATNNIQIGRSTSAGAVANIAAKKTYSINPAAGYWGIQINNPTGGNKPYSIDFGTTYLFSPNGNGIDIEAGANVNIYVGPMSVVAGGTHLKTGSGIQGAVLVDSRRTASSWTFDLDTTTAKYVRTDAGRPSGRLNGNFASGKFFGPDVYAAPTNQALNAANKLFATPVFVPAPSLLKTLSFNIGTGNTNAWNARMCVYADNGYGQPGSLVTNGDTGTIAISSGSVTGVQTANVNSTSGIWITGPSWYWIAFMADNASESLYSLAGSVGAASGNLNNQLGFGSAGQIFASTSSTGYNQTQTFGACPATFSTTPTLTTGQSGVPYVLMGF